MNITENREEIIERIAVASQLRHRDGCRIVSELVYEGVVKPLLDELEVSKSKCRKLASELSAVNEIHNEAVFITDDHYEQCPPEVQKIIRSLAVLQMPAYDAFLAEVRTDAFNDLCAEFVRHAKCARLDDGDSVTLKEATDALLHCADQLREGGKQ